MDDLMKRVYAYNKAVIAQEAKAHKVEDIKAMVDKLSTKPKLTDLLEFLRKLKEVLERG